MSIAELIEAAAHEPVTSTADGCLKCNVCNTVCPVSRVTDLFPGPKYVGPQAQRFRLAPGSPPQAGSVMRVPSPDHTVDLCSGCGFCTSACPAGVRIAEMNSRARAQMRADRRPHLRDWLLGQPDLLGRVGVPLAPLANAALRNRAARSVGETLVGVHRHAPLPTFSRRSFRTRWSRSRGRRLRAPGSSDPERSVVYFHGCAANYYEPEVAEAAISVLERNGLEVIVPQQVCCGLPLISNGLYAQARARARHNLTTLATFARAGFRIVGTSTSCTHTLKAEYREMLDLHDEDARAVSGATWDICELLLDLHERNRLDTRFGRSDRRLPYHPPCQLRSHGIGLPALDLLALVPGLDAVDLDLDCCGVAGTYGLKREKYDIAMAVGQPLFRKLRESGADEAACDSETCRWHIAKATGIRVRHPVQILAAAYAAYAAYAAAGAEAAGAEAAGAPSVG